MRIAQIAPVFESVPPRAYGGTERVVHWLAEALAARGHEVTVFAAGDSRLTLASLASTWPRALRGSEDEGHVDANAIHLAALTCAAESGSFDLVHSHVDWVGLPLAAKTPVPVVTTLHGRLDLPDFLSVARAFPEAPLVSISDSQRAPHPDGNWIATVHHGLCTTRLPAGPGGGYLAFMGRISPEKRPDIAIRVARAAGLPLKIAAKLNGCAADSEYWRNVVQPLLGPGVEFVGEIGDAEKGAFLGNARALLFPVDWPEPFGLVAIEALACGTPVIARPYGALPEIVSDGRTGFLADTEEEMLAAVRAIGAISREECRAEAETRFSVDRMAGDYERVYRALTQRAMSEATV